ncbi:hypothetical protein HJC23_007372 [Cyclotella cryptica]|uniref:Plastid lipid-associated protein/fibrillin conserved domain-containing protein n=1 Tax=Cyclotella cryptica TaxID=29204 RepID=A0ABD3Q3W0_9STRA|eukprot:CCRYP_008689-RA/>CCRYP_008689-RA protein AED:0.02 eAED:0.02 QI:45/1/1/1/1/1/2/496/286
MKKKTSLAFLLIMFLSACPSLCAYMPPSFHVGRTSALFSTPPSDDERQSKPTPSSLDPKVKPLKNELITIAEKTRRGFTASRDERKKVERIVMDLSLCSPTQDPAAAYYGEDIRSGSDEHLGMGATLSGKWTLIYTDAPDITSLEGGPLSPAKLGRIGQECTPPFIKNVIEWKKPDWASSLPFSGTKSSRILQKVCCKGSSNASKPTVVDLTLVGLEISGESENEDGTIDSTGPAAFFENFPVKLEGPLSLTFGRFEILYLDDDMRITRTYQGFTAVNVRDESEWF